MEQTDKRCPTHGVPLARRYKMETTDSNKQRKVVEFYCRVCSMQVSLKKYRTRAIRIERLKQGLSD